MIADINTGTCDPVEVLSGCGKWTGVAVCYCAAFLPKTRSLREMSRDAVMEEGWS